MIPDNLFNNRVKFQNNQRKLYHKFKMLQKWNPIT